MVNTQKERRSSWRRWLLWGGLALIIICAGIGVVWAVVSSNQVTSAQPTTSSLPDAAQLESRYDGKDPRGSSGANSKCADPPSSEEVASSQPSVVGPDGSVVGIIHLRTSPICPVIWARLLWHDDPSPQSLYAIPQGWTLHMVAHRPDTGTSTDATEQASGPIQYGLSYMLVTVRGCVYVEAYFSNGTQRTPSSQSSCVRSPSQ